MIAFNLTKLETKNILLRKNKPVDNLNNWNNQNRNFDVELQASLLKV